MPDDTIMDIVNNDETLYSNLQRLYERWYLRGSGWNKTQARIEAKAKATFFAEAIGQGHSQRAIREAVKQMLEEFEEHTKYHEGKLQAAAQAEALEAKLAKIWESNLSPEDAAQATHYEAVARKSGINVLREFIPASPAQIKQALDQGDFHLESIPTEAWSAAAAQIPYMSSGDLTLEEKILTLKHVAKWHYGLGNASMGAVEGWVITHDGETIKTGFKDDFEAGRWLHSRHSYSIDHAVRYEGYDIVLVRDGKIIYSYRNDQKSK